jgi:uncharacterized protein (TIGR02757 family)
LTSASSISRSRRRTAAGRARPPGVAYFEGLYSEWNHREFVHPDPLEFVYAYDGALDREIVGLVAASLAYGRVQQIVASVAAALEPLGCSPAGFVAGSDERQLGRALGGFKHRFTAGEDLRGLLIGAGRIIDRYGSLERAFMARMSPRDSSVVPALSLFAEDLREASGHPGGNVLPTPERGSACKRLHLFLRWMAREDDVDPGVWGGLSPALLIVPMDVHMHRIALSLGATARRQADLRAALETTEWFRRISPDDPVRYDFALTRLGMRGRLPGVLGRRRTAC